MNDINRTLEVAKKEYLNFSAGISRFSDRTINAYDFDLSDFISYMYSKEKINTSDLERGDIEALLANIHHSVSGSTANYNRKLSSLRSFFKFLVKHGLNNNPVEDFKPTKNHTRQISYLTEIERERLIETIKNKATPFYRNRDLAIISLFLTVGIRVSELTNLKVSDIDFSDKETNYIRVLRKGGSEDRLPISELVAGRIKSYLKKRKENSNEVFLSKRSRPLKSNSVYYLVKEYLKKAGIQKTKMGPHILRHTTAVSLLKKGVDLMTISKILGHKRLDTTSVYLHVEPEDIERAINLISI